MELKVIGYGELKDNNICEANAVDKNGNEYIIRWDYKKIKVPYDFTRSENIIEIMTIEGKPIKEPVHVEMNVRVNYIYINADLDIWTPTKRDIQNRGGILCVPRIMIWNNG